MHSRDVWPAGQGRQVRTSNNRSRRATGARSLQRIAALSVSQSVSLNHSHHSATVRRRTCCLDASHCHLSEERKHAFGAAGRKEGPKGVRVCFNFLAASRERVKEAGKGGLAAGSPDFIMTKLAPVERAGGEMVPKKQAKAGDAGAEGAVRLSSSQQQLYGLR